MTRSTQQIFSRETLSPSVERPCRCAFVVVETGDGRWLARDRTRGIEQTLPTQRAAIRYALFEAVPGQANVCALVVPSEGRRVG
jgi:hypothetical protein